MKKLFYALAVVAVMAIGFACNRNAETVETTENDSTAVEMAQVDTITEPEVEPQITEADTLPVQERQSSTFVR